MAQVLLSDAERIFIIHGVQDDLRCDGRGCEDYRVMEIETDVVSNSSGSARARLANTDVLVGVKAELGEPLPENPSEGRLEVFVDFSANADPKFEGKGGEDLANEISSMIHRAYSHPECLNLSKLSVISGTQCWILYLDILVLECGGNLFDAVSIASKAALYNANYTMKVALGFDANLDLILSILAGIDSPMTMAATEVPVNITAKIVKIDTRGWITEESMVGNQYRSLRSACQLESGDVVRVMFYKDDALIQEGAKLILNNCRLRNNKYFVLNSSSIWRLPREPLPQHLIDFCSQHVMNPINEYSSPSTIQGMEANVITSVQGSVVQVGSRNVRSVEGQRDKRVRDMKLESNSESLHVTLWDQCADLVLCVGDFVKLQDVAVSENRFFKTKGLSCTYLDNIFVESGDTTLRMYYLLAYSARNLEGGRMISMLLDRLDIRLEVEVCETMVLGALRCRAEHLEGRLDCMLNAKIHARVDSGKIIELVIDTETTTSSTPSTSKASDGGTKSDRVLVPSNKASDGKRAKPKKQLNVKTKGKGKKRNSVSPSNSKDLSEDESESVIVLPTAEPVLIDLTDSDSMLSSTESESDSETEARDGPAANRKGRRSKAAAMDAIAAELERVPDVLYSTDEDYAPPKKVTKNNAKKTVAKDILFPTDKPSAEDFEFVGNIQSNMALDTEGSLSLFTEDDQESGPGTKSMAGPSTKKNAKKPKNKKDGTTDEEAAGTSKPMAAKRAPKRKNEAKEGNTRKGPKKDISGGKNKKK